ncbi:hypothetical protein B0H10DRAFT_1961718 [Mycena sp. CBHHK59/15]|nr:hypothetical protein B0H10DRAFT_1961718 [Mycena sp. CBHHK59/15]
MGLSGRLALNRELCGGFPCNSHAQCPSIATSTIVQLLGCAAFDMLSNWAAAVMVFSGPGGVRERKFAQESGWPNCMLTPRVTARVWAQACVITGVVSVQHVLEHTRLVPHRWKVQIRTGGAWSGRLGCTAARRGGKGREGDRARPLHCVHRKLFEPFYETADFECSAIFMKVAVTCYTPPLPARLSPPSNIRIRSRLASKIH